MSSNDTDNTDPVWIVFRVKVLEWRCNVGRELDIIDRMCLDDEDVFAPQGSKPVPCQCRPGNSVSKRHPPKGLPESFYNCKWQKKQDEGWKEMVLCVSKQQFEWLGINCVEEDQ